MSEHRKSTIIGILNAWRQPPQLDAIIEEPDFRRSMSPEAQMDLMLRFETGNGPRTIVASGVSLAVASEIAHAMAQAGHFAYFRDQLTALPVAEHLRRRKAAQKDVVVGFQQTGS